MRGDKKKMKESKKISLNFNRKEEVSVKFQFANIYVFRYKKEKHKYSCKMLIAFNIFYEGDIYV